MTQFLVQCVVVLYEQSPEESKALSRLLAICAEDTALSGQMAILIQDNSRIIHAFPAGAASEVRGLFVEYGHTPDNPGLAHAYNRALELAERRGIPWLLLLDQDTCLTHEFLASLVSALQDAGADQPCAFVPELVRGDLVLSPQIVGAVTYRRLPMGFSGFTRERLIAFNSAACIRVKALAAIGGFPEEFWLDYLDHMVFHRLQAAAGRVHVLDSRLEHSLSLQNIETDVSFERYANVLAAEWMFVRKTGWGGGSPVHRLRLLKRAASHAIKLRNKGYALATLRSALS